MRNRGPVFFSPFTFASTRCGSELEAWVEKQVVTYYEVIRLSEWGEEVTIEHTKLWVAEDSVEIQLF